MPRQRLAVIAIGGNSLIPSGSTPEMKYQWDAVRQTCQHIAVMIEQGWGVVITHGNGPQVGFILRRAELAAHEVHTMDLDIIGADTQGSIGYMIQQALTNALRTREIAGQVVSLVTQTLVSRDDPAFENPTKPIGAFLSEEGGKRFADEGWQVVEDAGRGWRRVVASPEPLQVMELNAIRSLVDDEFIVVCTGGGGIPVIRNQEGELRGVPAVIDKDRASGLLASGLMADLFLISTAVEQVSLNFNTPQQKDLLRMTASEAEQYMTDGHFAPGSMKPKVQAAIRFLRMGGPRVIITDPAHIAGALAGEMGTTIVPG